ncbi:alpha amylase [Lysobacter sp. Root494]|nr:alpha amylase [Lysobacter sp. Root494]
MTKLAKLAVPIALAISGTAALPSEAATATPAPARAKAGEEVFYHVFLRSFRDSNGDRIGDLPGLTAKLDYLKQLGITSILLTPLQPSPYYHNYFATEFKAIEPEYGTMDDYFAFVRAAHARGLKVYLDQEFQYVAEGHPWLEESLDRADAPHAKYLLWRKPDHSEAEPFLNQARWEGYDGRRIAIAMVDMNQPAVQRYFQDLLLYWVDPHGDGSGRDGVDGLRIDHMMDDVDNKGLAKDLFAKFWTPTFRTLKTRRPGLRIIAEQYDWGFGEDWLTRGNADLVFAFPMRGALTKLDKAQLVKAVRETEAKTPAGKGQIVFLENHDTDRFMSLARDPARARAGAALALLLKGEPLIYYGQELGMRGIARQGTMSDAAHIPLREAFRWDADLNADGSAIWYRRDDAPFWTERYNRSNDGVSVEEEAAAGSLLAWYRELLSLRSTRPELRHGDQRLLCDSDPDLMCVLREDGARRSLLLVNLGDKPATPLLDSALAGARWIDLLGAAPHARVDPTRLNLPPMAVRVIGSP